MTKITLQLVTWNAEKYLSTFFLSLKNQSFTDWELLIWDNASSDKTVEIIQKNIKEFAQNVQLFTSVDNKGFAYGHNQLFENSNTELVALLSSDMYMELNCLEKLVDVLNAHKDFAVAAPRLMSWNFSILENDKISLANIQKSFSNKIDSLGLKVLRNRRVVELGQGEEWVEKKETMFNEVFGVSGALPVYRRLVIQNLDEFFDPLLENYKEDVDLAFRLRLAGEKAMVVPNAVAYHHRQVVGKKSLNDMSASLNKRNQNDRIKYFSYRNHLIVLYKNEYCQNFALDWPFILWYEFKKFAYFLLFDRVVLRAWRDVWKNRKVLKDKRNHLKKARKITAKEMRVWWR